MSKKVKPKMAEFDIQCLTSNVVFFFRRSVTSNEARAEKVLLEVWQWTSNSALVKLYFFRLFYIDFKFSTLTLSVVMICFIILYYVSIISTVRIHCI